MSDIIGGTVILQRRSSRARRSPAAAGDQTRDPSGGSELVRQVAGTDPGCHVAYRKCVLPDRNGGDHPAPVGRCTPSSLRFFGRGWALFSWRYGCCGRAAKGSRRTDPHSAARAVFVAIGTLGYFYALSKIPLADAVAIM